MARVNARSNRSGVPAFVVALRSALTNGLARVGLRADVSVEQIASTRVYRIHVIAAQFKDFRHFERQDLVWRIAEQVLGPDERLQISSIMTYTPTELKGAA